MSDATAAVAASLRERHREIESALVARIHAIADSAGELDPAYLDGLNAALRDALAYAIAAIESEEGRPPALPTALLSQARLAARHEICLDTVLRRYFAGYTTLGDFVLEAAGECGLGRAGLQRLLRRQAVLFDRLLATVSEEHRRELELRPSPRAQRRREQVEHLLAGELVDTSTFGYLFGGHHVGIVATEADCAAAVRQLKATLDCSALLVARPVEGAWIWLGLRHVRDPAELLGEIEASWSAGGAIAIGEPEEDLAGWRLTHRQAAAALPVAMRSGEPAVRYADVALLCAALRDGLLADSLRRTYLDPLDSVRGGGAELKRTLRAYFAAEQSVSSTALCLGVSRQTVASRLRAAEQRTGRSLKRCAGELHTALGLERLEGRREPLDIGKGTGGTDAQIAERRRVGG